MLCGRQRTRAAWGCACPESDASARGGRRSTRGARERSHLRLPTRRPPPMSTTLEPSRRGSGIRSFKVMDVVAKADRLARAGRKIYHLEVGQPQSAAPQCAIATAQEQMSVDRCGYTSARGEPPLRKALVDMYKATCAPIASNRINCPNMPCSPDSIDLASACRRRRRLHRAHPPHAWLVGRLHDRLHGRL